MKDRNTRPVSRAELIKYLLSLADINDNERIGNPRLSKALRNLVVSLQPSKSKAALKPDTHGQFADFSSSQVRAFLADETIEKSDLVRLAGERFSIPHSRLNKLPRTEIRGLILDALGHEESLAIISTEAKKGGFDRST